MLVPPAQTSETSSVLTGSDVTDDDVPTSSHPVPLTTRPTQVQGSPPLLARSTTALPALPRVSHSIAA